MLIDWLLGQRAQHSEGSVGRTARRLLTDANLSTWHGVLYGEALQGNFDTIDGNGARVAENARILSWKVNYCTHQHETMTVHFDEGVQLILDNADNVAPKGAVVSDWFPAGDKISILFRHGDTNTIVNAARATADSAVWRPYDSQS